MEELLRDAQNVYAERGRKANKTRIVVSRIEEVLQKNQTRTPTGENAKYLSKNKDNLIRQQAYVTHTNIQDISRGDVLN